MMYRQIFVEQLKQQLKNHEPLLLLDVRQPYEHEELSIPGSILIPLAELAERINELDQYTNREIIVYCKAGVRSAMACKFLAASGYTNLVNLADGMQAW